MVDLNKYNGENYHYEHRSSASKETAALLAMIAPAVIGAALPYASKPFLKQIAREHSNNATYKDVFFKAFENSGLKEKGLRFVDAQFTKDELRLIGTVFESSIVDKDVKAGTNAYFNPSAKIIKLNSQKSTIAGFHELGHAMNYFNKGFGKFLQYARKPGMVLAGLMGYIALSTREKPKEAKRNFFDYIRDNAGKIALVGMLPLVAEEALATHKGVKLAKQSGLRDVCVKNLRKFYGKALLSYIGYALVTSLSVYATGKIMDVFTRPKKVMDFED